MNCGILLGASSGIGNATYKKIKEYYPKLMILAVDCMNLKTEIGDKFYKLDLSNNSDVLKFIDYLAKENLKVQFLINSIGYQENIDILDLNSSDWDKMYDVTVKSVFLIEQFVAKNMKENSLTNKSIVNITSIHSSIIRNIAHYSTAKASLEMLTKEFAYNLSKYKIRVNSVAPGSIDTPLLRKDLSNDNLLSEASSQIPLGRHGEAREVADLIMFLISDKASYITGSNFIIDGGLSLVI